MVKVLWKNSAQNVSPKETGINEISRGTVDKTPRELIFKILSFRANSNYSSKFLGSHLFAITNATIHSLNLPWEHFFSKLSDRIECRRLIPFFFTRCLSWNHSQNAVTLRKVLWVKNEIIKINKDKTFLKVAEFWLWFQLKHLVKKNGINFLHSMRSLSLEKKCSHGKIPGSS